MKTVLLNALAVLRGLSLFRSRLVVLVLGLASLTHMPAEEASPDPKSLPAPKRVVVPKLQGPIKVDGDLSEPVWAKAAVLQPFYNNAGSGREREHTEVRIWYDDQALYLGWKCRDVDIQATLTGRDRKFWDEEVVEFFVTPKELNRYFELQWNPLNGVFDSIVTNNLDEKGMSKGSRGDWSFTAKGMTNAVKVKGTINDFNDKDEFWQVEIRLPFADLGQPTPKAKEVWRANFHRYSRTKGQPEELLSWSPTLWSGFHQPNRFGYLEFGE